MIFTKSLYYPHIEIPNESWLKTAILYWDKIQTIVPVSISDPYQTTTAKKLSEMDILIPLRVDSHMPEIRGLEEDVHEFLSSQEGMELLTGASLRGGAYLHPQKLPRSIRTLALHPEKMSHEIRYMIEEVNACMEDKRGFLNVAPEFANFYMTLLANKLSEAVGAGLVTETSAAHNLGMRARADASFASLAHKSDHYRYEYGLRRERNEIPKQLIQGALYNLLVEKINIRPDTPIEKILSFRDKHNSELCRFRSAISLITSDLPDVMSLQAMQQHISAIYDTEIKQAITDLKSSLDGSRIKWFANGCVSIAFLSVGSTSLLTHSGMGTMQALFAGAAVSLAGGLCLYNIEKAQVIRDNPYQYLVEMQRGF